MASAIILLSALRAIKVSTFLNLCVGWLYLLQLYLQTPVPGCICRCTMLISYHLSCNDAILLQYFLTDQVIALSRAKSADDKLMIIS